MTLILKMVLRYSGVDGSVRSEVLRFSIVKLLKAFRMQANQTCLAII
jgi:hypothetical protein